MSVHLQRDLDRLKKEILSLGEMVESATNNAMLSLSNRLPDVAQSVIEAEKLIDEKEVQIEESCLKILALHQPVAIDLRFIVLVLKVNNDLERMGDLCANVAARAIFLSSEPPIMFPTDFSENMPSLVRTMVHNSLDALVKLDVDLAREVIAMDNDVDAINRNMYVELQDLMERDSSTIKRAIGLLSTSRYLERIADLATNIAEEVVFLVEGDVIRHVSDA